MKAWLISIVGLAITGAQAGDAQTPPPPKPHLHYEIVINPDPKFLSPSRRLARACDLAKAVSVRTQGQHDPVLAFDLSMLRWTSCGKPDSN
jgi:hypothetical protein